MDSSTCYVQVSQEEIDYLKKAVRVFSTNEAEVTRIRNDVDDWTLKLCLYFSLKHFKAASKTYVFSV